jgi:hypothetical protein
MRTQQEYSTRATGAHCMSKIGGSGRAATYPREHESKSNSALQAAPGAVSVVGCLEAQHVGGCRNVRWQSRNSALSVVPVGLFVTVVCLFVSRERHC